MKKDIHVPKVEGIGVAIIKDTTEGDEIWNVYLINYKEEPIKNVLISSKGYGILNQKKVNTSTLRHRRSSKTNDEGDDYHQLDLASFLKITKISSQFQMILDYVDQLRNDIESNRRTRRDALVESQRSQKQFSSANTSKTKHTKAPRNKRTAAKLKNKAIENLDGRNPEHNEEDVHTNSLISSDRDEDGKMHRRGLVGQNSFPNSTFGEWRSKVLLAACEDAKQNMNANNTNDDLDSKENQRIFRREDILDFVVEGILERNGIV